MKPLTDSLKYSFLRYDESLPVIIASYLDCDQEEKLITLLKEDKEVICWTLSDIKSISPLMIQHRIHLEDKSQPY